MRKKVAGRAVTRRNVTKRAKRADPANQPGRGNDIRLIRPKSRFKTARDAWKDIAEKTNVTPDQVRAKHTRKAWRWIWKT